MSTFFIQGETLTNIGNAIREKTGGADLINPTDMPEVIRGISGGGGFPNSTKWTQSNIKDDNIENIFNANGLWVAGGSKGVYYSTNGKEWEQSNVVGESIFAKDFVYGNGVWVATCGNHYGPYYSTDGKTWAQSNITKAMGWVYYSNGIFIASDRTNIYRSTDGATWTQNKLPTNGCEQIINANGLWVAISGSYKLYYSTDGNTWTQGTEIESGASYCKYADGMWIVKSNNKGIYCSTDGKTWTQSNYTSGFASCIAYANGVWVVYDENSGSYYSTDGITWTQGNIPSGQYPHYVTNIKGIWYMSCENSCYCSTDGKTWTPFTNLMGIEYLTYSNGVIIGMTYNPSTGMPRWAYSTDCKTWKYSDGASGVFVNTRDIVVSDSTTNKTILNADGIWVAGDHYNGTGLYYSVTWEA